MKKMIASLVLCFALAFPAFAETPTMPDTMEELWEMYLDLLEKYNELISKDTKEDIYAPRTYSDGTISFLIPDPVIAVECFEANLGDSKNRHYYFRYYDKSRYMGLIISVRMDGDENFGEKPKVITPESASGFVYYNNGNVDCLANLVTLEDDSDRDVYREIMESVELLDVDKIDFDTESVKETWISGMAFYDPDVVSSIKKAVEVAEDWKGYKITSAIAKEQLNDIEGRLDHLDSALSLRVSILSVDISLNSLDGVNKDIAELKNIITKNPEDGEIRLKYRR